MTTSLEVLSAAAFVALFGIYFAVRLGRFLRECDEALDSISDEMESDRAAFAHFDRVH